MLMILTAEASALPASAAPFSMADLKSLVSDTHVTDAQLARLMAEGNAEIPLIRNFVSDSKIGLANLNLYVEHYKEVSGLAKVLKTKISAANLTIFLNALVGARSRAKTAGHAVTQLRSNPSMAPVAAPSQPQNPFQAIAVIFDACVSQWESTTHTCIVNALDPQHPTDGSTNPAIVNAKTNNFSPVSIPSSMPSDATPTPGPNVDERLVRIGDLKGALSTSLIGTSGPATPNPELENALHSAYSAGARVDLGKPITPMPLTVTFSDKTYGSASLTLSTTVTVPSVDPPQGQMAELESGLQSTANLNFDLMLGSREWKESAQLGNIAVKGLLNDPTANNQPTLTITSTVLKSTFSNLPAVNVQELGPKLEYVNSSTGTESNDLCGITQPVFLVYGISITAQFQCELSMGYGAYVDAQPGIGRVLVTPRVNVYLVGTLNISALASVVSGSLTGEYNLFSLDGQAGLYTSPVRDFFRPAGSTETANSMFYAMVPYAYANATSAGSVVAFTLSIMHLQTKFVLGLTPSHVVVDYPTQAADAARVYAAYITEIPDAKSP
jgi:hypothetical protein